MSCDCPSEDLDADRLALANQLQDVINAADLCPHSIIDAQVSVLATTLTMWATDRRLLNETIRRLRVTLAAHQKGLPEIIASVRRSKMHAVKGGTQ